MGAPANRVVSSSFDSPVFICGSREEERGGEGRGVGGSQWELHYTPASHNRGAVTAIQRTYTKPDLPTVPHPLYPTHSAPPTVPHPLYPTHLCDVLLFLLVLKEVHFVQHHHHLTAGDFANHQTLQEKRGGEEREGGGGEEREGGGRRGGRKATKPYTYT